MTDFQVRQEEYDAARLELLRAIDRRDYTASLDAYRQQITAARKAVTRAHKAMLAAWAA